MWGKVFGQRGKRGNHVFFDKELCSHHSDFRIVITCSGLAKEVIYGAGTYGYIG